MSTVERWREEYGSAWLYDRVADAERDPGRSSMFRKLGEAAREQAALIAKDIANEGATVPVFAPGLRLRAVALATKLAGPRAARPILAAHKIRGLSTFVAPPGGHAMPTTAGEREQAHRSSGGGMLRAGVFGANDGLVSNTCLILGVAGAASEPSTVLLTGVAGLLAGAFSMAAGEYVSVRSQREMFEYQIGQERDELDRYPEAEAEELALIYAARGAPVDEARALAKSLLADREAGLKTLAREELGLNPDDLGSPWGAAISSFVAFSIGAIVPLAPFALGAGANALLIACGVASVALFGVGATLSLFSGRNAFLGGLRMLAIGAAAGAATFGIGRLLGVGVA